MMAECSRGMIRLLLLGLLLAGRSMGLDYSDALAKSILYYEGQRSGRLPESQRVSWRGDSGLQDGLAEGVDLVGGYYDAGDNVKFGLPMAFTITMLAWSAVEFGSQIAREGQLEYIEEAIRWGTDYLIKAHPEPNVLWGQVGDGVSDHECWQRPEDMTTPRKAYKIDTTNPGSDLAGETSAAMSAASLALKRSDPAYASVLVEHAKQLFEFADKYRGKYDNSIRAARNFYTSKSGYADELLWAALWLYEATSDDFYLDYAMENSATLGGTSWSLMEFSWDVKYPGVQVLASKILLEGRASQRHTATLEQYKSKAEFFLCAALQKNNGAQMQRTPGGMLYVRSWNNLQYVVTASFLLTVYSDYLAASDQSLQCPRGRVESEELLHLAKSQTDYILGDNPRATSYLVGFGQNYPSQVHHRASSIVSIKVDETFVSCRGGYDVWYQRKAGDPNVLTGAVVGGPDLYDNFADERYNYEQTEPTSYTNGPLIGVLARLLQGSSYERSRAGTWKVAKLGVAEGHLSSKSLRPQLSENEEVVLAITQRMVGSWVLNGQVHYKYEVTVKNTSREKTVKGLLIRIRQLQGRYWGLSRAGNDGDGSFTFPEWLHSLGPLQSFVFVYAHAAPQAEISLDGYST